MVKAPRSLLPKWIKPQLTSLVDEAPAGHGWLQMQAILATGGPYSGVFR